MGNIGYLIIALQPILSTCLAMTKTDVRNCVLNLLTMSYCRDNHEPSSKGRSNSSSRRATDIASSLSIRQRKEEMLASSLDLAIRKEEMLASSLDLLRKEDISFSSLDSSRKEDVSASSLGLSSPSLQLNN